MRESKRELKAFSEWTISADDAERRADLLRRLDRR